MSFFSLITFLAYEMKKIYTESIVSLSKPTLILTIWVREGGGMGGSYHITLERELNSM